MFALELDSQPQQLPGCLFCDESNTYFVQYENRHVVSGMNVMAPSRMRYVLATLNSSYCRDMRQLFAVLQIVHLQVDSYHLIIWHFSALLPGRTKLPGLIFSEKFTYVDKQLCDSTCHECNHYGFLPLELCKGIAFVEQRCSWILLL